MQVGVALERHVVELHLGVGRELFHQQVRRGADAGRAVVDLARVLARRLDVLVEGLVGRIGAHREAEGVARDADDEGEVLERVPLHLLHVRHAQHAHRELGDGVAVGPGGQRHRARAGGAAAARLVLDDDRSGRGACRRARPARGGAGRSSRRPATADQRDRLGRDRPARGPAERRDERRRGGRGEDGAAANAEQGLRGQARGEGKTRGARHAMVLRICAAAGSVEHAGRRCRSWPGGAAAATIDNS